MKFARFSRPLAALLLAAGLTVSCVDSPVAPPPPPPPQAGLIGGLLGTVGRLVGGLLTCQPQPFASNTALIGPNGGTLTLGSHKLVIPQGALRSTVRITGQVPRDTVNSVRLLPEGLQFSKPAQLTLAYDNCGLLGLGALLDRREKRVAYTTEDLRIITFVRSSDDSRRKKVTGYLDHFSRYAVGW